MKLVIFDVDGTLTNTTQVDEECFVQAFESELGFFNINKNWADYTHVTDSGITQQIFQERWGRVATNEELVKIKTCFIKLLQVACNKNKELFSQVPGSANLLTNLRQSPEWCVVIATGGWYESATLKLQKANIKIEGIPLASANDAISREDIIKAAIIKAQNIYQVDNFAKIVYVGDGVWDVKTAYNLGISFVGIAKVQAAKGLQKVGAKKVIPDFTKVTDFAKILEAATIPSFCMNNILHITQREQWEQAKRLGSYRGDTLDSEGFIHCSTATQVIWVANRFFVNQKDLVILFIDSDKVKPEIRYEAATIGELFPHIYGELNIDAVFQVIDFASGEDGFFVLPEEVINLE